MVVSSWQFTVVMLAATCVSLALNVTERLCCHELHIQSSTTSAGLCFASKVGRIWTTKAGLDAFSGSLNYDDSMLVSLKYLKPGYKRVWLLDVVIDSRCVHQHIVYTLWRHFTLKPTNHLQNKLRILGKDQVDSLSQIITFITIMCTFMFHWDSYSIF